MAQKQGGFGFGSRLEWPGLGQRQGDGGAFRPRGSKVPRRRPQPRCLRETKRIIESEGGICVVAETDSLLEEEDSNPRSPERCEAVAQQIGSAVWRPPRPDQNRGRPACHQRSVPWTRDQFLGIRVCPNCQCGCVAALIMSAPFSAIMMTDALVLPETIVGMIDASTTRSPSKPRTRNSSSMTAIGSLPILHVPMT